MAVGAAIAQLQAAGVQVIIASRFPTFTAVAEASAAGLHYAPQFVVSNVGSDPPTLDGILTGGGLGTKLPAALIDGMISDTYLPLERRHEQPVDRAVPVDQEHVRAEPSVGRQRALRLRAGIHVRSGVEGGGSEPDPGEHRQGDPDEQMDGWARV